MKAESSETSEYIFYKSKRASIPEFNPALGKVTFFENFFKLTELFRVTYFLVLLNCSEGLDFV